MDSAHASKKIILCTHQKNKNIILCKFFVVRTLEHNLWNTTAVTDNNPLSKPEQRYHET